MKRFFTLAVCALCLTFTSLSAFAAEKLDEENLKRSVLARVTAIIQSRGGNVAALTPDSIEIKTVQPVQVGSVGLYAVKLLLHGQNQAPDEMVLVTERSGSIQFGLVNEISTGMEAALVQAKTVTQMVLPDDILSDVWTGGGKHKVQIVSDPFCSFCRKAMEMLAGMKDRISLLQVVHLPLAIYPGADAAVWMIEYAKERFPDRYMDFFNFAYSDLRRADKSKSSSAQEQIIEQFLLKFSDLFKGVDKEKFLLKLKEKFHGKVTRSMEEMGKRNVTGTPVVIIDGYPINGFDKQGITTLLSR